ncbi:PTS transporter subunit EIIC [Leuconostoc pseudomesenteroides]|uniref:PTS sugar transporter subunit IIC n=2 Tax=Lactobacillaceae TaxID=33958 RepID=UPI00301D4AF0
MMKFNKEKVTGLFNNMSPTLDKIGKNKYLQTIMGAMMALLPPIILGSLATLLSIYTKDLNYKPLSNILNGIGTITIGAMALYLSFLMAKYLVQNFMSDQDDGTAAGIISLMSFLIMTPLGSYTSNHVAVTAIPVTWLSSQGVFSAMVIGLIVGRLYIYIVKHGWTIKMPAGVPPMVSQSFAALIPGIFIGIIFGLASFLFAISSFGSFHQMIFSIIQEPLRGIGGNIWAMILVSLLMQIMWFFGIHGTNVLLPLVTPIWLSMDVENLNAVAKGVTPPNIIGLGFFNIITWGGLALGLVILMLFGKSKRYKELGKIAVVPALFGITEPVIFGTPLVLNFNLAIPFIFNNAIALGISYVLIKLGIVARFIGSQAIFGLPLGFHAGIEGHASIIILQLFLQLVLSTILWYPWFKHLDNQTYKAEMEGVNHVAN